MTSSQINDTFLFHRVIKILTTGKGGGIDVFKFGEIKVAVQELGLKSCFFEDTNLDNLTSGWPGTHYFKGDANFNMFPHAMGTSGSFKIVRTTASYFFSPSGHGKWAKKVLFRIFANYYNAKIFRRFQRVPYES